MKIAIIKTVLSKRHKQHQPPEFQKPTHLLSQLKVAQSPAQPKLLIEKAASPTEITSSSKRISASKCVQTENAKRKNIPDE